MQQYCFMHKSALQHMLLYSFYCSAFEATMCTKATELVKASVAISAEIKSLIVTTQSRRMEAQDKVSSAISKKVEEADLQRVSNVHTQG